MLTTTLPGECSGSRSKLEYISIVVIEVIETCMKIKIVTTKSRDYVEDLSDN